LLIFYLFFKRIKRLGKLGCLCFLL
jgi:hypothetical protein